ncbi:MAB_1171c family putative transporter [Streptomyces sp. CC224B]|uniref:MAB_1171c family putative transporter n=1 Tax=Streptomyces sp. CC224B TaxID=3044571 RepID=UPI0024A9B530|nr:MAB_1171c family putative transporter [Streptomyces sp. CC224B]
MYLTVFFIVLAAAGWKIYQLARAPRNQGLRWLTLTLVCATGVYPLVMPTWRISVDTLVGIGTAKVLADILFMAMTFSLMIFCLFSADGGVAARRRARTEGMAFVVVVAAIVGTTVPLRDHASLYGGGEARMPVLLVAAYIAAGIYLIYTLSVSCRRTWHYARMSHGAEAAGLWVATAGIAGMVAFATLSTGLDCNLFTQRPVGAELGRASAVVLMTSIPLFVIGVTWPGARSRYAACRLWLFHRRAYRELEPLWRLLSSAFPETVLPDTGWGRRNVHRNYARRVIECRDGLVRVSPHLLGPGQALPTLTSCPQSLAVRLIDVVKAVRRGECSPHHDTPVTLLPDSDYATEVGQLLAVSNALSGTAAMPSWFTRARRGGLLPLPTAWQQGLGPGPSL